MKKTHFLKLYASTFIMMLLAVFSLHAQVDFMEYNGKVIDGKSKKTLEAVSLNVNETNISTITNSEGEFTLKVPKKYLDSKVVISILGYNTRVLPLSELSKKDNKIMLYEAITELSAVSVSAYKNAESLVKKVFNDKNKNIQDESVYMTAFYRETIKRRNRNVSLTEAVVNILKQPNASFQRDAIQLGKARKSTDYRRLDTVSVKLQGGPFSAIYLDVMKYPEYIFTDETISSYNFSFDEPTTINNRSVFVVSFTPKNNSLSINYNGKLYIDVNTLALVSANYALDVSDINKSKNLLVRKKPSDVIVYPLEANYKVDYKAKGNKWYYSYSNLSLKFKVNKKREIFNKVYTLSSEMAVTDWEVNTADVRIKNKDRLRPTVIITDAISGFSDPNFWGEYNLIEPDKSIQTAIDKIRKNIEKQKGKAKTVNGIP
ncbi:carboxypeptidase-like regulatory domain-containing protein [Winogradskyella echinorum]|uniref:Carboxypeptidase-like regulatory domain-containing protein n=1 Tax=Winogradskyella echinorum TaxID=538189 RepID=A0ABR6Y4K9_9FLAO|nr:carboxypeptidase-like regulatory domain-containing protein [Winogradskyella echinorum]MBC3847681.1 carboxypeptidase-like regulatory domain-containing protein [Winogradskyella echinorum]MBC5752029.1 carboxypeptidase-like regulatory domain-containing protein [Winogradskyella echinorum]